RVSGIEPLEGERLATCTEKDEAQAFREGNDQPDALPEEEVIGRLIELHVNGAREHLLGTSGRRLSKRGLPEYLVLQQHARLLRPARREEVEFCCRLGEQMPGANFWLKREIGGEQEKHAGLRAHDLLPGVKALSTARG